MSKHNIALLAQLQEKLKSKAFSGPRASIASVILNDTANAQFASANRIAELAGTHNVAVGRMCKALGYAGWKEFRQALQQQAGEARKHSMELPASQQVQQLDTPKQVIAKVAMASETRIGMVVRDLLPNLKSVLPILTTAERIDCYGYGGSAPIAFDAQHKFLRLGISGSMYQDPHMQAMSIQTLNDKTVILAFSNTGETTAVIKAVEAARKSGARVIAICPRLSNLARTCDYALFVPQNLPDSTFNPLYSRIGHMVLIDILATLVRARRSPDYIDESVDQDPVAGSTDTNDSGDAYTDIDALDRIRELIRASKLSAVRTRVARTILADPKQASELNGKEAAAWADTNQAEITRTAQKLGYAGWPDFAMRLKTDLHIWEKDTAESSGQRNKSINLSRVLDDVKAEVCSRIKALTGGLADKVHPIVQMLAKTSRIDCYGFGGSAPIASDARYKLFRLGIEGTSYSDPTLIPMSAVLLKPKDIVLAFSLSGATDSIIRAATTASATGAKVIAICPRNTPLVEKATHHIHIAGDGKTTQHAPRYTRVVHMVLIDIITILLAQHQGEEGEQRLLDMMASQRWLREPNS